MLKFKYLDNMSLQIKTMSDWKIEGEEPEILFWVGSAGSFDDRAKKITRAFVKIMNQANVQFGVLGVEESASGDVAKRAGNEFLFQMQAMMNIEVMNKYNVTKIVTTCPHDFNTIKNEYQSLGGDYEVYHHTEFICQLIEDKRFVISNNFNKNKITYHDPCYLGRGNNIFNAPRKLIKLLGLDLVEMKRSKATSFCCGAGGAQMFKEPEKGREDININRTREALATNVNVIATGCPFCNTMMRDGVKYLAEDSAQVLDIAEIIVKLEKL